MFGSQWIVPLLKSKSCGLDGGYGDIDQEDEVLMLEFLQVG